MKDYKDKIIEDLDRCLVTEQEFEDIMNNGLTAKVENDPFKDSVFPEDQGDK